MKSKDVGRGGAGEPIRSVDDFRRRYFPRQAEELTELNRWLRETPEGLAAQCEANEAQRRIDAFLRAAYDRHNLTPLRPNAVQETQP